MREEDFTVKATIASLVKRTNAMKILLFLSEDKDNEETYYLQRIADDLDMNECTAFTNLEKLIEAEIVTKTMSKVNRKTKYYLISDNKLAQKVIDKYKQRIGFYLARLISYEKQYASQLKKDERFVATCEHFGLTISEGIETVLSCHKIEKESTGNDSIIWRKEQGYDKPEQVAPVKTNTVEEF